MWLLALLPFVLQALTIGFDELWFHCRRGLPKWERIGHPIDTFSVFLCMGYVLFVPFSRGTLIPYCLIAAFSCLLVTKDEFVHKDHCPASENWLHAILFTLHPITLTCAAFIWPVSQGAEVSLWIATWLDQPSSLLLFLRIQFVTMGLFMLYQIVFWNFIWKDKPVIKF
ncbi:MAG: hypothetical protein HY861_04060 [Chlamydiia bacterium]|nr:hypothetical protein [Chlamydiia bacterium]